MRKLFRTWLLGLLVPMLAAGLALAQVPPPAAAAPARAFTQQELDQILAPIALYPDALLSQILMASTYPFEVIEAARWSKAHPELQGDSAVQAVEQQAWDPSVKSLVAFPRVLAMMDERLDWMRQLGDAFLEQEPHVMDTVQSLRQRAMSAGNLGSNDATLVSRQGQTIVVTPASPQVVYVPYYDPLVVYGNWWWPAYPPVRWAPWPGYYVRPGVSVGVVWGGGVRLSVGFFFGAFDWPQRRVHVVRVPYYYRPVTVVEHRHVEAVRRGSPAVWRHDAAHRRSVAYRNEAVRQRYEPGRNDARREFGGHREPGRVEPERTRTPVQARPETRERAAPAIERREERRDERRDVRRDGRGAADVRAPRAEREQIPPRVEMRERARSIERARPPVEARSEIREPARSVAPRAVPRQDRPALEARSPRIEQRPRPPMDARSETRERSRGAERRDSRRDGRDDGGARAPQGRHERSAFASGLRPQR